MDNKKLKLEDLIEIEISDDADLDGYIKFKNSSKENMSNPEWIGDFTKESLQKLIEEGTKIWIYYTQDNKEPVCSMMLIPANKRNSLKEFNLDLNVVDYGPMFVNPKYTGNGLQYQMFLKEDEYSIENGYSYAICTAHPDNIYSINNIIKNGFELKGQKQFTRGIRNIYLKELVEK